MTKDILIFISAALFAVVIFFITLYFASGALSKKELAIQSSEVIVEDQTVCYSTGFDGWKRVGKRERTAIAELVAAGKVTVLEAQTLECTDYSKQPLKVFLLREQWWKRGKN